MYFYVCGYNYKFTLCHATTLAAYISQHTSEHFKCFMLLSRLWLAKITVLVRIDLLYEILEAETSTTQPGLAESTHRSTISSDRSAQHQDKEAKGSIFMAQVSATVWEREREYISVTALELWWQQEWRKQYFIREKLKRRFILILKAIQTFSTGCHLWIMIAFFALHFLFSM